MIKNHFKKTLGYRFIFACYLWALSIVDLERLVKSVPRLFRYLIDWLKYSRLEHAEPTGFLNSHPRIHDRLHDTPIDPHYFYQDIWAFKKINKNKPVSHVDVGSGKQFVGFLTAVTRVKFVDIRPIAARLQNLEQTKGSILKLPFADNSIESLSCLHVAEHIGLGRYGDELDPEGTKKACAELMRVLAPGGVLYFSLPLGRPRVCFNAHRIHSPQQILNYLKDLILTEFSGVDDSGVYHENISHEAFADFKYGCGLFVFTKPK